MMGRQHERRIPGKTLLGPDVPHQLCRLSNATSPSMMPWWRRRWPHE
jgi:hypothetical protein